MILLSDFLSNQITSLPREELVELKRIRGYAFYDGVLTSIELPKTLKQISGTNFPTNSLENIDFSEIPPSFLSSINLTGSPWFQKQPEDFIIAPNGKILLGCKKNTVDGLILPSEVINLGTCALSSYNGTFTKFVIPDNVEIVQNDVFSNHETLTTLVFGTSVRYIGSDLFGGDHAQATTLVFKQPAGMYIDLPNSSNGLLGDLFIEDLRTGGMFESNKELNTWKIYTNNEYIKAYDWSADHITPEWHELEEWADE